MNYCSTRINNRAILLNSTTLSTILNSVTRRSVKYAILKRFCSIRDDLIQVSDTECSTVPIDRSSVFKNRTTKYTIQLQEIN